jgi:multidrug efflux pump subunit AcrA (membrane-fusion protein)
MKRRVPFFSAKLPSYLAVTVVAVFIIVVLAVLRARYASSAMDMASMQSALGDAPVPVTLAAIRGSDLGGITIAAPANVEPYLMQTIVTRASGLLTDFSAYTGDRLHAGQIVAHLDEPELQSDAEAAAENAVATQTGEIMAHHDVMIAQANLAAKAEQGQYWSAELHREKMLFDQGAVSRREYEDERVQAVVAQSAYEAAQAKLGSADAAIGGARAQTASALATAQSRTITAGYTNVLVPDNSVVVKRLVDPGVYVQTGTPILQVAVLDRLRVQAQVAQQDLLGIGIGTPVDVAFDDGNVAHGRVTSLSPVVDPQTHTAIAEAIVPNAAGSYQPGGFAHVTLHVHGEVHRTSFTVPSAAIVGGTSTAIWIDKNDIAHRVPVTVLSDDGVTAQIRGDLHSGTRVVVTGASNLEEDQAITEAAP